MLNFGDFNVFRFRRLFDYFIFFYRAVENRNSTCCVVYEKFGIVRNHDDEFVFGNVFQKFRDFSRRFNVQVPRRLVRQNNRRVLRQRSGYYGSLFFAARKFTAALVYLLYKPDLFDEFPRLFAAYFFIIETKQRKLDVFKHGKVFYDVEILKDGCDILFAVFFPFCRAVMRRFLAVYIQFALFVTVVRANDVQKRRFTASALALDRYEFVIVEIKVDSAYTDRQNIVAVIYFSYVFKF